MGLDTVELVLETEERFGIQIEDEEASRVRTMGDFHALVLRKLSVAPSQRCLTAMAFYRLRRAMADAFGVNRRWVRPQRRLDDVLPRKRRRRDWPILSEATGLRMPQLQVPEVLPKTLFRIGLLTFVGGIVLAATRGVPVWATWSCGAAAIALVALLVRPLATCPLGTCKTVGDLSRAVFDLNVGALARSAGEADGAEIWPSLVQLVSEQLGVRVSDINPDSRFIEDLNCG
jgi:acyl carrier protein